MPDTSAKYYTCADCGHPYAIVDEHQCIPINATPQYDPIELQERDKKYYTELIAELNDLSTSFERANEILDILGGE